VTATVLVPCGPQQQQQHQHDQQQETGHEDMVPAALDMPGQWQVLASRAVKLSRVAHGSIYMPSNILSEQVERLGADHFLLRAHCSQVRAGCGASIVQHAVYSPTISNSAASAAPVAWVCAVVGLHLCSAHCTIPVCEHMIVTKPFVFTCNS
jgi:hypothetical protein